jgi:hypothetical protein
MKKTWAEFTIALKNGADEKALPTANRSAAPFSITNSTFRILRTTESTTLRATRTSSYLITVNDSYRRLLSEHRSTGKFRSYRAKRDQRFSLFTVCPTQPTRSDVTLHVALSRLCNVHGHRRKVDRIKSLTVFSFFHWRHRRLVLLQTRKLRFPFVINAAQVTTHNCAVGHSVGWRCKPPSGSPDIGDRLGNNKTAIVTTIVKTGAESRLRERFCPCGSSVLLR